MLEKPVGFTYKHNLLESVPPSQRMHLILLGVDDLARARDFFLALDWVPSATGHDEFVKFDLGGYAICLISRKGLSQDAFGEVRAKGFNGVCLVHLVKTPEEVPAILAKVEAAGGKVIKPATRTPWGIAGYFEDPDGHLFEVDYEPTWVFDAQHKLIVDELNQ